ncbi:MAG: hypothetical protein ABSF62_14260 [Bryobacteraceae bacterium]
MRNVLRRVEIRLGVAAAIVLVYLLYVFLARHNADRRFSGQHAAFSDAATSARDAAYGGTGVRILQFYARDGVLYEGKSTVICYGLANAKSVTIDPPFPQGVYVAFNRCVEAAPKRDTTYVLAAEGEDGKTVSASFTIRVQADPESLPRITSFAIDKHVVEKGRHIYTLAFAFQNGKDVSIDPPVFSPIEDSAPFGQFFVAPDKTTTYTLTVAGKFGHKAQKKLTIEVKDQ